jgi:hypothetical protein
MYTVVPLAGQAPDATLSAALQLGDAQEADLALMT